MLFDFFFKESKRAPSPVADPLFKIVSCDSAFPDITKPRRPLKI